MIHVSFVGCGGMAAHYLGVYRDLDWVRVVICIDADPAARRSGLPRPSGSGSLHRTFARRSRRRSTR